MVCIHIYMTVKKLIGSLLHWFWDLNFQEVINQNNDSFFCFKVIDWSNWVLPLPDSRLLKFPFSVLTWIFTGSFFLPAVLVTESANSSESNDEESIEMSSSGIKIEFCFLRIYTFLGDPYNILVSYVCNCSSSFWTIWWLTVGAAYLMSLIFLLIDLLLFNTLIFCSFRVKFLYLNAMYLSSRLIEMNCLFKCWKNSFIWGSFKMMLVSSWHPFPWFSFLIFKCSFSITSTFSTREALSL